LERRAPRIGDIVLRREAGPREHHYEIRQYPAVSQVSYRSFEVALEIATRYARAVNVAVWHEEDGRFVLIESRAASI